MNVFISPPRCIDHLTIMEVEKPMVDCASTQPTHEPPSQSKRPGQALYIPKPRLQGPKDKTQNQGEVKPRPKPRYTVKVRKNAKNRKDKANKTTPVGEGNAHSQDVQPDVKEERLQEAEEGFNGQSDSKKGETEATQEGICTQVEEESWDTLFNDDGDCLDPHLLEEVRV